MATTATKSTPGTVGLARKMFARGTNFFSYDEIALAFGPDAIPGIAQDVPLPTEEEMARAKELGQRLSLCGPITMEWMRDRLGNVLGNGKLLYGDWYLKEGFYQKTPTANWHWRFTTEDVIPGSASKNYLDQTRLLIAYLTEQVYGEQELPKLYAVAIEEFKQCEESLMTLMSRDWQKAAEALASLQVNQLCRETPDQVLWDVVLNYAANGEYSLPGMYTWTNQRSSGGFLVCLGRVGGDGVGVRDDGPRHSYSNIGVRFSRSALV